MLKSILVGLDETKFSEAAVELGIAWAQRFDCLLTGVAVICEPMLRDRTLPEQLHPSYKVAYDQLLHDARERCDQILSKFALRATAAQVSHKLLEDMGLPAEQIAIEAQRYDLIMLGQETHFEFESTTHACQTLHKLLRNPPRPVVAVPPTSLGGEDVLVAYDGSATAARALQAAVETGLLSSGHVHVLSIDANDKVVASKTAQRAVEFLDFHGVSARSVPIHSGDSPSQLILDEALGRQVGLIVMGAYGHSGIAEWLFGSTTKHIIQHATVPLFLYH
jgi:nucleotide-binding universal stress UspA family protein